MCLIVAFILWIFMTLDEDVERDFQIVVTIEHVPDSVVLINEPPKTINVTLKGKGSHMVRYMLGATPTMKIDFRQYAFDNKIQLNRGKLDAKIREIFGQGITLLTVSPDNVTVNYTSERGTKLPLTIRYDVTPNIQAIISGPIKADVDSVEVYAVGNLPRGLESIETELLTRHDVSDTTVCELAVKPVEGVKIIPSSVKVTIPAELLISKRRKVNVTADNLPENVGLITFPNSVEITCLVPMRLYNRDLPVKATVDYRHLDRRSKKVKVDVTGIPGEFRLVSVKPDSLEYYIEEL